MGKTSSKPIKREPQSHIPCIIAPGAFPQERFVKVDAKLDNKPITITAFVPTQHVRDPAPTSNTQRNGEIIVATIRPFEQKNVALLFPGELLSGSNPVRVDAEWFSRISNGPATRGPAIR